MKEIQILKGVDLLSLNVDAIVLDANDLLKPQDGMSRRVYDQASWRLREESDRIGFTDPGKACLTGSHGLNAAPFIIHTLSAPYGSEQAKAYIKACYQDSVRIAQLNGLTRIAFMLLGTEHHGWPEAEALQAAKEALAECKDIDKMEVLLVY